MIDLEPHFKKIHERFIELEKELAEGEVFSNPQKAQELTREHSRLRQSLDNFAQYQKIKTQIKDNEQILQQPEGQDTEFIQLLQEEQQELNENFKKFALEVQAAILPPDPNLDRNVIVEIRAGTGGNEAALFAADLFRMYSRYIERYSNWKMEVLESSPADLGGLREVIFQVSGESAYKHFQFESGVHRVQRVPATEAQGRIHTSTATVAVLPEAKEVDLVIKPEELRIEVCRAGGPGGQGVNTTDSAVQVMHIPSGLIVRCQDGRSQIKNKEKAISILRSRLLEKKQTEEAEKYAAQRKSQVGSGDRNEKIRTYNYPQNRITDHRINFTIYDLTNFMEGDIQSLVEALLRADLEKRLATLTSS